MAAEFDPNAAPDPNCAACKVKWSVHVDKDTGDRWHLDAFRTDDYGVVAPCPTDHWPSDDEPE